MSRPGDASDQNGLKRSHANGSVAAPLGVTFDGKHFAALQPLSRPGRINYPGAEKQENGLVLPLNFVQSVKKWPKFNRTYQ